MTEVSGLEPGAATDFSTGLRRVRKRRWLLWGEILGYLPLMLGVMKIWPTNTALAVAFLTWFALLWVVVGYSALARCPRCGNYFHMNGMTLLYLRKCLHCQLHLTADRKKR
jgi:hypothetical protein